MANRNRKNRHRNQHHGNKAADAARSNGQVSRAQQEQNELHTFFTTDPDTVPQAHFEPPLFQKNSKAQMARSQGKRQ